MDGVNNFLLLNDNNSGSGDCGIVPIAVVSYPRDHAYVNTMSHWQFLCYVEHFFQYTVDKQKLHKRGKEWCILQKNM